MKTTIRLQPLDVTDADVVRENRHRRFFDGRGICAGFERMGDPLWPVDEIARTVANRVPGLSQQAVIDQFRFSVRAGRFGPPASRGRLAAEVVPPCLVCRADLSLDQRNRAEKTRNLIDLDSAVLRPFEPGQYPLRPSILVATVYAEYMRARQSVWAHWIAAQEWPVPPEFAAPLIEGEATTVETATVAAPALPAPGRRESYRPWLTPIVLSHVELTPHELAILVRRQAAKLREEGKTVPDLPKQGRSIKEAVERIRRDKRK